MQDSEPATFRTLCSFLYVSVKAYSGSGKCGHLPNFLAEAGMNIESKANGRCYA